MRFYVIVGADAGIIGCETSKAQAIRQARREGSEGTRVEGMELCVKPREAIRRLLGNAGGYATNIETVYEVKAP